MKQATIREVRAYVIATSEMGADYHNQNGSHWIIDLPIANPMSVYEEYRPRRTSWGINALGTVLVEVELNDGTCPRALIPQLVRRGRYSSYTDIGFANGRSII